MQRLRERSLGCKHHVDVLEARFAEVRDAVEDARRKFVVEELRRMKPVIIEALEQCCAWIRDEWPHIENN